MANSAFIREVGLDGITLTAPIPASQPGDTFPAGAVILYAGGSAPTGWAVCDGSQVSRATYPVYAAQMATDAYPWGAGDGSTTVHIPDFRDQVPVGKSGTKALGSAGGEATHVLSAAEMPVHSHTGPSHTHSTPNHTHTASGTLPQNVALNGTSGSVVTNINTGAGNWIVVASNPAVNVTVNSGGASTTGAAGTGATGNAGSGTAHNNMQPYKAINYIIRLY